MPPSGGPGEAEASARPDEQPRSVERLFLGEPTRRIEDWRWLWDGDHRFPTRSRPGVLGRLILAVKKVLRPFAVAPQADLWERQRIFNLIALEYFQRGEDIRREVLETHAYRLTWLESIYREGLSEVVGHNDALFARVDQKLDHSRRELREVWARLASALAAAQAAEPDGTRELAVARAEQSYLSFERRFRGSQEEILARVQPYIERLAGKGEVLDLGCGRGEALAVFQAAGITARGVDGSQSMVEECRRQGLRAERQDLFDALTSAPESSLGGVVSFHVIEHLPGETLDRLVRLARRALKPGGVLILETPNPASLVVASRNFWRDPTHLRPVHPETLEWLFRDAGFDPVERLDLHPFTEEERLPELATESLSEDQRPLATAVNELRDRLDDLLYGAQDYAVIGTRPR